MIFKREINYSVLKSHHHKSVWKQSKNCFILLQLIVYCAISSFDDTSYIWDFSTLCTIRFCLILSFHNTYWNLYSFWKFLWIHSRFFSVCLTQKKLELLALFFIEIAKKKEKNCSENQLKCATWNFNSDRNYLKFDNRAFEGLQGIILLQYYTKKLWNFVCYMCQWLCFEL